LSRRSDLETREGQVRVTRVRKMVRPSVMAAARTGVPGRGSRVR
jgi:hypothetical protein